jgi:hypothetical protein
LTASVTTEYRAAIVKRAILIGLVVLAFAGCHARPLPPEPIEPEAPKAEPLIVGVCAESPPMVFRRGNELVGLETDFARASARAQARALRTSSGSSVRAPG